MIVSLLNTLFGCAHSKTTFPLTPSRKSRTLERFRTGTYIVCLDCGKEFDYDWREMRIGSPIRQSTVSIPALHQENPVPRSS
jgi:hypothetical protein